MRTFGIYALVTSSLIHLLTPSFARPQVNAKWAEGEHLELGEVGARRACAELGVSEAACPLQGIRRADKALAFTYGELIAAADYYRSPDELYSDRKQGIKKVLQCAHRLHHEHPSHRTDEKKYKGCEFTGIWQMGEFWEVVSQNYSHFGWQSLKAYVELHTRALKMARQAYLKRATSAAEADQEFAHALILNAFADHYLTDAFASGHIRLPRTQLKAWSRRNLPGHFKAMRGDILAIVLHENESRDLRTGLEQGFPVRNSLGDLWFTRSDQYLRVDANPFDPTYTMPLAAVTESFSELLIAWRTGETPEGIYGATRFVPFPADVSLVDKFSTTHQKMPREEIIRSLHSALPFYQKLFASRRDLSRMLRALPEIFAQFRKDIRSDLDSHPELSLRLPSAFIEAYLRIE